MLQSRFHRITLVGLVPVAWSLLIASCSSSEACECIAGYGSDSMESAAIAKLQDEGLRKCFTQRGPGDDADAFKEKAEDLQDEAECLPMVVGNDARNGFEIEVYYSCSDVCPDAGFVGVRYRNVDEASCCASGGEPMHDAAWGGYLGCIPPEAATASTCASS